ncbi:hypothetical protein HK405_012289 [Cladochytrium tenue]|nr:hypothetical protein HK405_012289 [Cladochytrium tenue]
MTSKPSLAPAPITRVGLVVFPGFQALDAFGPMDALNVLSMSPAGAGLSLCVIAATLDPVSTYVRVAADGRVLFAPAAAAPDGTLRGFGQSIMPTHTFATAPDDLDLLIVPGGLGTRSEQTIATVVPFLRERFPRLRYLMTVCTGAGLAAQAGVLDGRRATTNKSLWSDETALGPNVDWVRNARWVEDRKVWTASGISAGIDCCLAWVAHVYGETVAKSTADIMEYVRSVDPTNDPFTWMIDSH